MTSISSSILFLIKNSIVWLPGWIYRFIQAIAIWVLARASRIVACARLHLRIEGLEQIPHHGPVIIAARHFHHFYDGCILLGFVPRRIHIFVALDWVRHQHTRRFMELICALVRWPVMLRTERLKTNSHHSAYTANDARRYLVRAVNESVQLLQKGEVLVIFPEAYPNIDPVSITKQGDSAFLPFRSGFVKLVERAERKGQQQVAIIPAGFTYTTENGRWHVVLRFGPVYMRHDYATADQLVHAVEQCVYSLSGITSLPPR